MQRRNYTINDVTQKELDELKEKIGSKYSETVRRAVHELWIKEVRGNK